MTTPKQLTGKFTLPLLRAILDNHIPLTLSAKCKTAINVSVKTVNHLLKKNQVIYGINTGFGKLANTPIDAKDLSQLQHRLLLSHATGVGPLLDDHIVRIILALKINSLARGYSGVRLEVVNALLQLYNQQIYPCIPAQGSVGASGDLAPLAHLSCALIGVGNVHYKNKIISAKAGLKIAKLTPLILGPKEGLALLNGTQVSTALALAGLFASEKIFAAAIVAGSLAVEAALGSHAPFDARIQEVRGHQGQIDAATYYRKLLKNSAIQKSHQTCNKVQDPYSLRCQPQVMGACLTQIRYAADILLTEANAVTDNPLIFPQENESLSGGNFHAEPVAFAADALAVAVAEIASLSERRIALLVDPPTSNGLPAFLVKNPGLNSGFMIAQVTAASLVSENKTLAHPASVDSIPTSANQEDHVSMATFAARKLLQITENCSHVIAIELLTTAQGIDLRAPLKTSLPLQKSLKIIRKAVPHYAEDRFFSPDIVACKQLVSSGIFLQFTDNKN